jgi:hypothetical protein
MTQQVINIGAAPDDGTGDQLRVSFDKCNQNFTELYTAAAPIGAEYITSTADATLTAERVLTDTATVTWDRTTAGQIKANAAGGGGGNVSNSGTPTNGQLAQWTDATHIQGVAASTITAGLAPLASPTFTGDPKAPTPIAGDNDTSIATTAFVAGAIAAIPAPPPQGRLTLQTLTPVMTTTQSAKTAIFYTPYVGNQISLYDGTSMAPMTFAELTVATTNTANSPAAIGASKVNDWFVWDSGGGVLRLVHGPDWTNDLTRSAGTALVRVKGIWLNNASITNGPAASRGTYVGTTRSNASSQLDWIYGTVATGGGAALLNVWNCYNRILVKTIVGDDTDSWTYSSVAWRPANGNANNSVQFVSGLQEESFSAFYHAIFTSCAIATGVGLNSTTVVAGLMPIFNPASQYYSSAVGGQMAAVLGANIFYALENAYAGAATVSYGDAGSPETFQAGLYFEGRM